MNAVHTFRRKLFIIEDFAKVGTTHAILPVSLFGFGLSDSDAKRGGESIVYQRIRRPLFLFDHPQAKNIASFPVVVDFLDLANAQLTLLPFTPVSGTRRHEGTAIDD